MDNFRIVIVEDVALELKGTLSIIKSDIPEATVVGTAMTESELWPLLEKNQAELLLLDLGLGGSTTIGVDICRRVRKDYPAMRILVFTGEILNERLWVDVLDAGADGIALKTGELLTRDIVLQVMEGRVPAFNQPILEKIVSRYKDSVREESDRRTSLIRYDIDEYDERLLRHLALGYTKDMISELRTMPFSSKSLEKRQQDLVSRLFPKGEQNLNVTRLVARAIELHIIDPSKIEADE
ncbi:MAG: DUF5932 domain-containing protein [Bacteroidaceae bacterium]|nr:DUF5932 domain-containing protein [Bacteroidaceae bacterium]